MDMPRASARQWLNSPPPDDHPPRLPVTIRTLRDMVERGETFACLTCYDATTARWLDRAGVPVLLVGDTAAEVILGYTRTIDMPLEVLLALTAAVKRGAPMAHVMGDMPFMSYQASVADAVRNAGRLVQEGGADAVKLEGGAERAEAIRAILAAGIPVMGHLGLTPQSVLAFGGFKVQGRGAAAADRLVEDARALEAAGCFALVLEGMPASVADRVTAAVAIPTIGIGAGAGTDGQVLVIHDLLGYTDQRVPKFVRRYADLDVAIKDAARRFIADVRAGTFPAAGETYSE